MCTVAKQKYRYKTQRSQGLKAGRNIFSGVISVNCKTGKEALPSNNIEEILETILYKVCKIHS